MTLKTFLLKVTLRCLLCFALAEPAWADVKGIPHAARFDSAIFPHARTVTGCTEWRRPRASGSRTALGDSWGPVSFAGACELHDQCYHTESSGWGECNQRFLGDMRAACNRDLKREALEKGRTGDVDVQALQLCYEIANMYFAKVQETGAAKRYELAQRMQGEYMAHVKDTISAVYQSSLGRKPTALEADRAMSMLQQDYGIEDLKTALMGAKLDGGSGVATAAMPMDSLESE